MKLINSDDGRPSTTSKIIADVFGKVHRVTLKAVDELECSDEFRRHNFMLSHYLSPQNKKIKCYNITEKGFYFLAMGFTGKKAATWKEAFIEEFDRLRNGTLSIDERMTKISKDIEKNNKDGSKWAKIGHEICRNKKLTLIASQKLLDEVQLTLQF